MKIFKSAKIYAEMIKLGHTLFALPFALSALCLAYDNGFSIDLWKFLWIVVAFAAARSAAMGFNRIVDVDIDILNPRTKNRPTATGEISKAHAKFFTIISIVIFIFSAGMINTLCLGLSPLALIVLLGYSYFKRFSSMAHYALGLALALAPIGAWIAAADTIDWRIISLGAALFFHIAGFDIIYALQDMEFDKSHGLHSIPARFGKKNSLIFAGLSFFVACAFFALTGTLFDLNLPYWICVGIIAIMYVVGLFLYVKYGAAKTNLVFFYENASISALILLGSALNLV